MHINLFIYKSSKRILFGFQLEKAMLVDRGIGRAPVTKARPKTSDAMVRERLQTPYTSPV